MKIVNCGYDYRHPIDFKINRPNGTGDYILLVLRSPAFFTFEKKTYRTTGNSVVIFNKGTPQNYGSDKAEYINDWIHFECDEKDIEHLKKIGVKFDRILQFKSVNELSALIKHMCLEKYSDNKNAHLSAEMYFNLIMLKISDLSNLNPTTDTPLRRQLQDLKNNIYSNPQKKRSIDAIAKELSLSSSYLQHQYKNYFGVGIKKDITLSRIEYSKYLLFSTNYTIAVISDLCGYDNDVHFMRVFKKETGLTPTEYRKSSNFSFDEKENSKKYNPFSLHQQ